MTWKTWKYSQLCLNRICWDWRNSFDFWGVKNKGEYKEKRTWIDLRLYRRLFDLGRVWLYMTKLGYTDRALCNMNIQQRALHHAVYYTNTTVHFSFTSCLFETYLLMHDLTYTNSSILKNFSGNIHRYATCRPRSSPYSIEKNM